MNILRTIGAFGAATVLLSASVRAQGPGGILPTPQDTPNRQGTRGANFLHIGIGARGGAMAGAVGSSVAGPTGWFWNPAGAASSESFSLAAGRQNLYDDLGLEQTYVAGSIPALGGVVGFHLNTLGSGPIRRTSEANPFGERLGGNTFEWTSTVIGLGYAKRLTDRLSVGGQFKYITEGIPDASTKWMAFDIGTQFSTGLYGLTLGGAIQNVGGQSRANGALIQRLITTGDGSVLPEQRRVEFFTRETEIPVEFRLSVGADILGSANSMMGGASGKNTLIAELSVTDATDYSTQYAIGAEYGFRNLLFLRGGKRMYNDDRDRGDAGQVGLSGGFGLRLPVLGRNVRFDYSYEAAGALQNIQIFSFEVGK
ncbi:MAG: PorV/PorQ family protein [Gemmatimonas sp.]